MMRTEAGARALERLRSAVSALSKATYWYQGFERWWFEGAGTDDGGAPALILSWQVQKIDVESAEGSWVQHSWPACTQRLSHSLQHFSLSACPTSWLPTGSFLSFLLFVSETGILAPFQLRKPRMSNFWEHWILDEERKTLFFHFHLSCLRRTENMLRT